MRLKADIKIQRKDIAGLHEWLDRHATGWVYWGSATAGELDAEQTDAIRHTNDNLAANSVAKGRGDLWSTLQVILPDNKAAMLCKLAWLHADVERPLQGQDDARKQPIGGQCGN